MTTPKNQSCLDGFDILLADHQSSTHEYEDHDANLREVLRPWSQLSTEGKLHYIASAAALYNVPFERFEHAAREAADGQPLPAGERAYLRLHMEYQRTLWEAELPAFPREHTVPKNDPHHDALDTLDAVLHVKFERLLDDYLGSKQHFADADGQARNWPELSAEGKVEHIARLAAIFDVSLPRFTEAVHDALDGQPLHTDEQACLRLQYQYAYQVRHPSPYPLPLAPNASQDHDIHNTLHAEQAGPAEKDEDRDARTVSLRAKLFADAAERSQEETAAPGMVHFKGFLCEMQWKTYPNGRPALYLVDAQTRETVAVATADLPEALLAPGEVFIKDHSENRGMLAALQQAGVVKATGAAVRSGFAEIPVAALLPGHGREASAESQPPESARHTTGPNRLNERQHKR